DPLPAAVLKAVFTHFRAFAVAVLRDAEYRHVVMGNRHADDAVALIEANPNHAVRGAAHGPDVLLREADRHTLVRRDQDVVVAGGQLHVDELIVLVEVDGDDPRAARVAKGLEAGLLHGTLGGDHEDVHVLLLEVAHRQADRN